MPEIIESLADIEGVPPSELSNELEGPLYNYVDAGALERFVTHSEGVSISFIVESYRVDLDDRQVMIYEESYPAPFYGETRIEAFVRAQ